MKDHKQCKHCERDNKNPHFCDFCGRPVHESFKEREEPIMCGLGDLGKPIGHAY